MHVPRSLLVFLFLISPCESSVDPDPTDTDDENDTKKSPKMRISFAESIRLSKKTFVDPEVRDIRQKYWTKTFDEIRDLAGGFTGNGTFLGQWKLLLEDSEPTVEGSESRPLPTSSKRRKPPRFEGFPSWDRLLQDWADDVQDYLDKAQAESDEGYLFGNYGRPAALPVNVTDDDLSAEVMNGNVTSTSLPETQNVNATSTILKEDQQEVKKEREISNATSTALEEAQQEVKKKRKLTMPIPVSAKPGEPVLPHTDISDLSKRILVVTTASLPWKTGTAVNPLLRAAYLTKGRKEAGGSATLMLPWLERPEDQVQIYGEKNAFASPEDQEEWIRTWLRDSADMAQASEDLIIQWYTAWQNPAENSIYSMGDITALIPAESVDICILEEPEHLNWYVSILHAEKLERYDQLTDASGLTLKGIEHRETIGRRSSCMLWVSFTQITFSMHLTSRRLLSE
jgi:hypothetical protein